MLENFIKLQNYKIKSFKVETFPKISKLKKFLKFKKN